MNHPIDNPKFNKLDYIRNGVFATLRTQFTLLLEEGCSLQQLSVVAGQMQAAVSRAYQLAAQDAVGGFTGPTPEAPVWNTFPDESEPESPTEPSGPNPFEDS